MNRRTLLKSSLAASAVAVAASAGLLSEVKYERFKNVSPRRHEVHEGKLNGYVWKSGRVTKSMKLRHSGSPLAGIYIELSTLSKKW